MRILIILLLGLIAFFCASVWRAKSRDAAFTAAYPPAGEIVVIAGRKVHVVVKGSGPDLVLIHGAGGNALDFTFGLVDRLSERYRVFIVDRPGLGHSEQIDPAFAAALTGQADSPQAQAQHLSEAVRQLGAHNPLVLGHSYGASVAMAWALNEPTSGVLALSGATMPWPGKLRPYYRIFGSAIGSALGGVLVAAFVPESRVRQSIGGVFAPEPADPRYFTDAGVPLAIRTQTFRANARQVNTLRPHVVEMARRYPNLELPVEILHGTADLTVQADIHAKPLAATLPNANLTLVDGAGHAPHHTHPDDVIAAIDRLAARAGLP